MAKDRSGWKGGRFSVDYETGSIYRGLRDWQRWTGESFNYYRFEYDWSSVDSVYGEADSPLGRVYFGPNLIPALHIMHTEVNNESNEDGFYENSTIHVTLSYNQLTRLGLTRMDIETKNYLKDRFVYKTRVFRVTTMEILGKIQERDIIVAIDATQVKPEEMANDKQFSMYAFPHDSNYASRWNLNTAVVDPSVSGQGVYPLGYTGHSNPASLSHQLHQISPSLINPGDQTQSYYGYGQGLYGAEGYGGGPITIYYLYGDGPYGAGGYGGGPITS
jgi:hypothetical protein